MENLKSEVKNRLDRGERESDVRKFVRKTLGLGKSQGNVIFNKIKNEISSPVESFKTCTKVNKFTNQEQIKNLEFNKKWIYNKEDKTYVVFLKSASRAILVDEETHNNMQRAYTSKDETRVEDICSANNFPLSLFAEYKTVFGWTRNGSSFSDEVIENNSVEDLVENTVQNKRWEILQESKKRIWKETENNSRKWIEFEHNYLEPFRHAIEDWKPVECKKEELKSYCNDGLTFLCALSDNHIGECFSKNEAYHGREFNSEVACEIIDDYFNRIAETVSSRKSKFKDGVIVVTGDYLHSCIDGNTRKGTHLHSDKVNQEMFKIGLNALQRFIENFSKLFPRTKVIVVNGNHESVLLTYLSIALEKYFLPNKNVSFVISEAWAILHKFGKISAIITHGGHDRIKTALPPMGIRLKSYIQSLFLVKGDELHGSTQRIVLSGHKHSFSQSDMGSFEFYCLGASVLGDNFSDALGLHSTPRQNCLILDDSHVLETLHYYF